ncbi:beta-1,3-glucanase domain-containing protein [Hirsutella rhossiliensis]|uniref:Beta-1,3-glucanase domain-containing protein n=1 Tax=Hirsutella rhossiliensis TaxID=111463 RepID=A0A9P8SJ10_9HYPO|nr:beta-1,3-glucanase domain-containing protein [Hirsutella rhossiliensis]KAH0963739.1 beta-1,3-glucanase domain-containing protein [Hirsutella rhossiliensis]
MRQSTFLLALLGVASASPSWVRRAKMSFSIARPGGVGDVVVNEENLLHGTYHDPATRVVHHHVQRTSYVDNESLQLEFVNNHRGGQIRAYISGLDSSKRVVFVKADGSLVYPSSGGSNVPVPVKENIAIPIRAGSTSFKMTLPIPIYSGRVWFAEGELRFFMVKTSDGDGLVQPSPSNLRDPSSGIHWGFAELTYTKAREIFANISYVDFVGLILSVSLKERDKRGTQLTRGLGPDSISKICSGMVNQSGKDGFPWDRMCVANDSGTPIRVLSPNNYAIINDADFRAYWNAYVDDVWKRYSTSTLTINTQSHAGNVKCKVSDDMLKCSGGDNRGYPKPTAEDIWGCNSGPFERHKDDNPVHVAVIPRLCAAFVRSTLLLSGGEVQPRLASSSYYTINPASHYSRLIHELEVDGRGYAFPYDDVNPDEGGNASGLVSSAVPDTLTIYVGGSPP